MYRQIINIFGMPRSGTSWLSQIFDSSPEVRFRRSPLFSYEFKNYVNEQSGKDAWEHVFKGAYLSESEFMNQTVRRNAKEYPVFTEKDQYPEFLVMKDTRFHNLIKRLLELFENVKAVMIVRHPCGSIHSWLKSPSELPSTADPMREWRTGSCRKNGYGEFWGFEDWKLVTHLHLRLAKAYPERCIIQKYEDLVRNPVRETKRLFAFCGLRYSPQTNLFIKECHTRHVENEYAVYKNPSVAYAWRSGLSPDIKEAILNEIAGTDLEEFIR